jgi:hypothetical protein
VESDPRDPPAGLEGNTMLAPYTYPIVMSLNSAIYRIVVEFYPHLDRYKYSKHVAAKLEKFLKFER